jgi:hypothetical protein
LLTDSQKQAVEEIVRVTIRRLEAQMFAANGCYPTRGQVATLVVERLEHEGLLTVPVSVPSR